MVICLFPYMQELYAYMYLGLRVDTRKTVCHCECVFGGKNTSSIWPAIGSVGVFSMAMICQIFFCLYSTSIPCKRSYDITEVELLALCVIIQYIYFLLKVNLLKYFIFLLIFAKLYFLFKTSFVCVFVCCFICYLNKS